EKTVSQYVLYWGSDKETKLADSPPIATLAKGQGELSFNIPKGTVKPINATHILVRTKNKNGEMSNGPGILIVDKGVPTNWATSVAFKDSNPSGGKVDGTVSVSKALSEEDLTDYVLYWSADSFSKLGSPPIAVLPKTGKNLAYSLPKDTALPPEAKYLLVVTKNSDGEMSQGVSALIVDVGVPVNAATSVAFKDSDMAGGKIGGEISVSKSLNESDITHYYLYFGSSESTKQNKIPFAVLPKTGNNLKFNVPTGTLKPTDATHILVFTRNADGEMATGVSAPIADLGVPENAAVSVSFRDENVNGGKIDGTVSISRAVNEKDLTHYVVYFGTDASTKQSTASVAEVAKTGANLNVQLPAS
ncbi:hypothetical protein EBR21_17735, partial [bacterium]|nr:hypothetical protein [bacterium]